MRKSLTRSPTSAVLAYVRASGEVGDFRISRGPPTFSLMKFF